MIPIGPPYILRLPGTRLYVVNTPSIIPLVQKQRRNLAFEPISIQAATNMMGVSSAVVKVIRRGGKGGDSYFSSFVKATHVILAPGNSLKAISRAAAEVLATSLTSLRQAGGTRHELLIATTEAIHGPQNPFRVPVNEESW